MRKLLLVLFIILMSCSPDKSNCAVKEDAIVQEYADLIRLAYGNQSKIDALWAERNAKLLRVCR